MQASAAATRLGNDARDKLTVIQRAIDDVGRTVARMRMLYRPGELDLELTRLLLSGWGHRLQGEPDLSQFVDRILSKPPRVADVRSALAELTT